MCMSVWCVYGVGWLGAKESIKYPDALVTGGCEPTDSVGSGNRT